MIAPAKNSKSRRPSSDDVLQAAPLFSAEAEKAVLGSMLAEPEMVIDQVVEKVARDDFFVPAHRELFMMLKELHDKRQAIDITTCHQHLVDRGLAEAVGSPGVLAELAAGLATHLNVSSYVRIVKDKSLLRHLQTACITIAQNITENPDSVTQVLDQAETAIFQVTDMGLTNSTVAASEEIPRAMTLIENFKKRAGRMFGVPTGFHRLNELTTGWHGGEMIVLAARPGMGKTSLAMTFAWQALKQRYDEVRDTWVSPGYSVGVFSLEMTNSQLMLRLLASCASMELQKIRKGELSEQDMAGLQNVASELREMPLYLDDSSFLTINQLRAKARRMKSRYNIELLVIDYLQLLHSESDQAKDSRQNEVAEISRGIKALAKELDIPIIVLAQLNRKSEEGKAEPALHNLRESGSIEQDADIVMLLHREEPGKDDEGDSNDPRKKYTLNIAKQRNGPTDKVDLIFHSHYTRFDDPVRHEARSGTRSE